MMPEPAPKWTPLRGWRARRAAARRLPPLADGRRDPLLPPTDAPTKPQNAAQR